MTSKLQVGSRMKREGVMEFQDCVISQYQNVKDKGYGCEEVTTLPGIWSCFWNSKLPTWNETLEESNKFKYIKVLSKKDGQYCLLNTELYKKRTELSAKIMLIDAHSRALNFKKKAYLHVVGLGLGVWRISKLQEKLYVEAWGRAIQQVDTSNIACIDFSWIDCSECLGAKSGETIQGTNVQVKFSKRNLHDPVPDGTFLVCNFAWDGNSLPGNEYWTFKTSSTGDSAAASSTCVAELHNHYINSMVTAENLHIATSRGVFHIGDYAKYFIEDTLHLQTNNVNNNDIVDSKTNSENWFGNAANNTETFNDHSSSSRSPPEKNGEVVTSLKEEFKQIENANESLNSGNLEADEKEIVDIPPKESSIIPLEDSVSSDALQNSSNKSKKNKKKKKKTQKKPTEMKIEVIDYSLFSDNKEKKTDTFSIISDSTSVKNKKAKKSCGEQEYEVIDFKSLSNDSSDSLNNVVNTNNSFKKKNKKQRK